MREETRAINNMPTFQSPAKSPAKEFMSMERTKVSMNMTSPMMLSPLSAGFKTMNKTTV